jgi:hypothetical protein
MTNYISSMRSGVEQPVYRHIPRLPSMNRPPIKLTATIYLTEILLKVELNSITLFELLTIKK